jgi:hypothetical protein
MLKVIQRFSKHCSCHFQGEYVGKFWKPYIGQAVDGKWDMTGLTRRAGCYLIGHEHMVEEKRGNEKFLKGTW